MGHPEGLQSLLMFISDLDDVPTRHRYVGLVREHAQAGNATAMAALSSLTADSIDKKLFDYRESVRWILGAPANRVIPRADPDERQPRRGVALVVTSRFAVFKHAWSNEPDSPLIQSPPAGWPRVATSDFYAAYARC